MDRRAEYADKRIVNAIEEPVDTLHLVEILLARQPILNAKGETFAYELLFRADGAEDAAVFGDGNAATSRVIANSLMSIGFERVLGGRIGFINFTRDLLLQGTAYLLPRQSVVVELLESITPDEAVLNACQELKKCGYRLALDDFAGGAGLDPLIHLADFVKVDFRLTTPQQQADLARRYGRPGVQLLAEKVETKEEFERARNAGYTLFQGYYFSRPETVAGRDLAGFKVNYVKLFEELRSKELRFDRIEAILKKEVSLAVKLLRYLNSAMFHSHTPVSSIRQALAMLGEIETRRWTMVAALSTLVGGRPSELVTQALIRARFCEILADDAGVPGASADLFLTGLISGLSAVMGRPLERIAPELGVSGEVMTALLGQAGPENRLAPIYSLVCAYESAEWDILTTLAAKNHVPLDSIRTRYVEAVAWADQTTKD